MLDRVRDKLLKLPVPGTKSLFCAPLFDPLKHLKHRDLAIGLAKCLGDHGNEKQFTTPRRPPLIDRSEFSSTAETTSQAPAAVADST